MRETVLKQLLQKIPAVHELQKHPDFINWIAKQNISLEKGTQALRITIDKIRQNLRKKNWNGALPGTPEFIEEVLQIWQDEIKKKYKYKLTKVINASGTVLHTNLGRARLSKNALLHTTEIASSYSNLEYQLANGKRGSRHSHIEEILTDITHAEAAMVVNNNAAAVYLILKALAWQKEVVVSRGQLVEIGGSFRISAIMEESGAILKEVGTTNKTHMYDYEQAISEQTAMLMKVHTSNFKTIGFTESVSAKQLVQLAKTQQNLIVYEDLGSGVLYDFSIHQIGEEPLIRQILSDGIDLVSFSGDKLLGGPQAGIIVGKKKYIDQLKKHQLARVLRVDKMTIAALEATLLDYMQTPEEIPVIRDLIVSVDVLKKRAEKLYNTLFFIVKNNCTLEIMDITSTVGGGTMPGTEIPSIGLTIQPHTLSVETLRERLRTGQIPIVCRAWKERLLFDVRTITEEEISLIGNQFQEIFPS